MKTIIVNSYRVNPDERIIPYIECVSKHSEFVVVPDVVIYDFDTSDYDALILSGSPDLISCGAFSKSYLEFLKYNRLPTLGICYGHQLLAKAFGAKISSQKYPIEKEELIRIIKLDPIFAGLDSEFIAQESHREYVEKESLVKAGFELLAVSESCEVEAIKHIEYFFYGVQFHPERSGRNGQIIFENFFNLVRKLRGLG
ncbi:MAG: gamma-glutamyl-gamma-aminobutyrate hydrolase family protein [candidate division WOR-3 bacterium]|nr:gamma-glutamyl-gamma-aminobutyrate hydrolase family protein [candidate division WOR-3 bacterium]MCX7757693.1 gamma-glutamyl-gamma-aminobutyrate hydrolase family protein [candidate division WOR-3 bacterium]MDW7987429.1 gamma-glutamyl-gamma-aminobutyrate hydrolase family protein [candidate division WOR-3 bacterium]